MEFGEVLKKLRADKGMSQQMLADALGIRRTTVTNYESGSSYPSFRQLLDIVKLFDVSSDYLLGMRPGVEHVAIEENGSEVEHFENGAVIRRHPNGTIEVLKGPTEDVQENVQVNVQATGSRQNEEYISEHDLPRSFSLEHIQPKILVATQDITGNLTVPIVNRKAAASYLSGYQTQEYFEHLDAMTVPAHMLRGGQGLIIQATNDSMEDTIFEGDMLLCRFIEAGRWDEIPDFSVCVIVSESRGIQVKRVKARFNKEGLIRCKSDNRRHQSFNLFTEDIHQIWQVALLLTATLPNRADTLYRKIDTIEENVDDMRELYEGMRKKNEEMERMMTVISRNRKLQLLMGEDPDTNEKQS